MSNAWKIYMLAIVSFLVGTSEFIIAGILDKVAADIGVSVSAAGQLITVFSLAYAFGTPFLMAATARMERRKLLLYSLAVFVIGNGLAVLLPGFGFLVASRVILAMGTGVFVVTALTVASKLAPPEKQGSAIATLVMGFSTALIVGVPLGRLVASVYNWKLIFGGIGVLGIAAMFIISIAIPQTDGEEPVPLRQQLALLKQPRIVVALLVTFFWIAGYSITYTYISPFLLTVTKMSEQGVSAGLFAFGIASLIGSKLGGFSTDRWGVSRTLVGGMLLHAIALILISLSAHSPAIVFPLLMLWSFSAWSSGPTQQYHLISLAPEASSIMLSLNSSVLQLAMAAGAGIGGVIVEQASLTSISWIGAAGVTIAAGTAAASFGLFRSRSISKAKKRELQKAGA
ncbi:putative MFS-type transporter YbcL [Paenibacillus baekrokdamisoli]|uniref:Putative MFS-type transporter YbcL n=1 Tax=Paenibacillus baekrokdamisoli TaxID=1712516 RepID=A0A3G9IVF3_9BACL|nr:MFS transporter [Paenibacillus baekrokdamisoli]MBB3070819.1 DHA1 family putative efflux transporter-like MFS transporter [Paenibacillus baekrokdamisoli]BBH22242.1 putative MFS-type transporter YbcL [Paenibacillus baekrokdamisoli]